ncbi:DegV family protein [Mycoplasma sp. Ms02]|uniref:DegV family protein n=1 Tax=Mycoplasma sp. Ms02 TaxID=353851 RepID=UPI001C8AC8C9|nr:DegV family protein [Mycoplasma sp. Ms02]QZE12219.1 DegV family protein [Mycoplasma sp. Ms02]
MKNIAIVVDSSCGLTKEQVEEKGWFFLPLHIEIDQTIYDDGINLNSSNIFEIFSKDSKNAKTSLTKPGEGVELFEKLSKEYEHIVFYPISKHLSGQYQAFKLLESEFPKLKVVESKRIAQLIVLDLLAFEQNLKNGMNFQEAFDKINDFQKAYISLMPKYNDFLVKGGRLHAAAATVAKLFKIIPIIKFEDGQLLKEDKGRVFDKTVNNVITKKANEASGTMMILHSGNQNIDSIVEYAEQESNRKVYVASIAPVVAIHTGPEAVVVISFEENYDDLIEANSYLFK